MVLQEALMKFEALVLELAGVADVAIVELYSKETSSKTRIDFAILMVSSCVGFW